MSELILVTDSGKGVARSSLAAVRALAAAGYTAMVAASGNCSLAAASRYCQESVLVPSADDPGFAASIRDAVRAHGAAAVIAASDAALIALGAPVDDLVNKARLGQRAMRAGILMPATERFDNAAALHARANELPYPIVLKPEISRTSTVRIAGPEALLAAHPEGPVVVQPYLDGPMMSVSGLVRDGRLAAAVHQQYLRTWPVDCGTSCAAISIDGNPALEAKVTELLAGYEGIFQAQFRDGYLLDLNPRVYGSLPLAVAAGVNLAALQADLVLGKPAPTTLLRGRAGVRYRWLDGDLRHIVIMAGRGRLTSALAASLPRRGTVHSIFQWRDPRPVFVRMRRMLAKMGKQP